jgi:exodeoxyribonuclease-3
VNSIRTRIDLLISWLEHRNNDIDVLCLQELKVADKDFPGEGLERLGYQCEVYGQKGYNGVAICSKTQLQEVRKGFGDDYWDSDKRIMTASLGDIRIVNVYAPHGGVRGTEKFDYKLKWYTRFMLHLKEKYSPSEKAVIVGDFNVARADVDVYNPRVLADTIGTMTEERAAFEELLSLGLVDTARHLYPEKKMYTWCDYIGGGIWKDEGMRIDYILCTKPFISVLQDVQVDLWPRRRRTPKPSDHAPVIGTFKI